MIQPWYYILYAWCVLILIFGLTLFSAQSVKHCQHFLVFCIWTNIFLVLAICQWKTIKYVWTTLLKTIVMFIIKELETPHKEDTYCFALIDTCVGARGVRSIPCLVSPMNTDWGLTHHSNWEVVVYNAVRHRVPSLLLVCGCDINLPAI